MSAPEQLARQFLERHPEAAAELLAGLQPQQLAQVLVGLETPAAIALVQSLPAATVSRCLDHLGTRQTARILAGMPLRHVADILRRVADPDREPYLLALPTRLVGQVRAALAHMQDTVAALMDSQVRSFRLDSSVEQTVRDLEREADGGDCRIYLTDVHGRFAGVLPVRVLFSNHPHAHLGSLSPQLMTVLPEAARLSNVVGHPDWLRFTQLPVVDAGGRFVGVLRRERLNQRSSDTRPSGPLTMGLALVESYTLANAILLDLLLKGSERR